MVINENTKISLGWVVGLVSGGLSCLLGAVLWASSVHHVATQAAQDVEVLQTALDKMSSDIRIMRESQIRMEDYLSYYKKKKYGDDNNR